MLQLKFPLLESFGQPQMIGDIQQDHAAGIAGPLARARTLTANDQAQVASGLRCALQADFQALIRPGPQRPRQAVAQGTPVPWGKPRAQEMVWNPTALDPE
jgi:hypothetical protein